MSIVRDLDDTANLAFDHESSSNVVPIREDDTARMRLVASARSYHEHGGMHPFAEGIIRFFRARTILDGDMRGTDWNRAWRYLEKVTPHDLPPMARKAFFELTYFMQEQLGRDAFNTTKFKTSVRAIASLLDEFVDELNVRRDR